MKLPTSILALITLSGVAYAQTASPSRAEPTSGTSTRSATPRPTGAPFGVRSSGTRALTPQEKANFTSSLANRRAALIKNLSPVARQEMQSEPGGFDRAVDRALKQTTLGIPTSTRATGKSTVIPKGRYVSKYLDRGPVPGSFGAESVSWAIKPADLQNDFERPDLSTWGGENAIPKDFPMVSKDDWRGVFASTATSPSDQDGLTRGHLADSGSSMYTREDQKSTYKLMTNALPQWADANAGAWHTFERDSRELARRGYHIYNSAGPIWTPHTYTTLDGKSVTVQPRMVKGKIPVPTAFWKMSVAVPPGGDIGKAFADARSFAVIVPNNKDAGLLVSPWTRFATTGADIEKKTGLKFFTGVPDDIRNSWLNHRDQREGFDFGFDVPDYKESALRNIARNGGNAADVAAAQELLRAGRLVGGEGKRNMGRPSDFSQVRKSIGNQSTKPTNRRAR